MNIFDIILWPFKWVVSAVLWLFHELFTLIGLDAASGWTWVLAIVGPTLVMRTLTIPLFLRQIRSMRGMQEIQPQMAKLQAKYKGKKDQLSRQAMAMEQQALMKEHKANPFAACLPLLIQMPFFFALYQVLIGARGAAERGEAMDALSADQIRSFEGSTIFGARMSDTFMNSLGAPGSGPVIVTAIVLILLMSGSMFFMQKMLMTKNMTQQALSGPMMQTQQIMLYAMPLIFGIGGINFPIGVLLYWTYSNFWAVGQQWWIIRNNPTPGSLAEKELNERRAAKGLPPVGQKVSNAEATPSSAHTQAGRGGAVLNGEVVRQSGQRVQPQRKNRRRK